MLRSLAFKAIFSFSASSPTYTPTSDWTLIFYDRSNFHTHRRTYYAHLRGTTQFSRINEPPPLIASTTKQNYLDINSTCYKLTSPTSSGRSATSRHHLPDLCTVPRTHIRDYQQTKKSKNLKKTQGRYHFSGKEA